jgi:hypothetical protein
MSSYARTALPLLLSLSSVSTVDGHGSLVIPQTRNSIDRLAAPWKGGYPAIPDFPGTGRWGLPNETCGSRPWACQEGCSCSNGTEACDVGQSCFWFTSGTTIGCDKPDGDGRRVGPACRCAQCASATVNRPEWRTTNRAAAAGSAADWTRYNPWRVRAPHSHTRRARTPTDWDCSRASYAVRRRRRVLRPSSTHVGWRAAAPSPASRAASTTRRRSPSRAIWAPICPKRRRASCGKPAHSSSPRGTSGPTMAVATNSGAPTTAGAQCRAAQP